MPRPPALSATWSQASRWLRWPSQCALCRRWAGQRLCGGCLHRFAAPRARCVACALRVPEGVTRCGDCVRGAPPWDAAVAAVDYAHPWDALIPAFKFRDSLDLARVLAGQLAQAAADRPRPDWLLPVPLSEQRLRTRGFNQAWELTRRVGRLLQVPTDPHLLLRVRHGADQHAQPLARRADNVAGAFAVEPLRREELSGRRVALIDDVMTTGATCREATLTLRQAGARHVEVWVLARTPRSGP